MTDEAASTDVDDDAFGLAYSVDERAHSHAVNDSSLGQLEQRVLSPGPMDALASVDAEQMREAFSDNTKDLKERIQTASVAAAVVDAADSRAHVSRIPQAQLHEEMMAQKEVLDTQRVTVERIWDIEHKRWEEQVNAYHAMVRRMDTMENTAVELKAFLSSRLQRLQAFFAAPVPEEQSFCQREIGTLRQAAMALELLAQSNVKHFEESKASVFEDSLQKTSQFSTDLRKQSTGMKKVGTRLAETVVSMRVNVKKSWDTYERMTIENIGLGADGKENSPSKDPYLSARTYIRHLGDSRHAQTEYAEQMNHLFRDLQVADGRRIDALKTLLTDYLLAEKNLLLSKVQFLDESIKAVKAIDREQDVSMFVKSERLIQSGPETLDVFTPPDPTDDMVVVEKLRGHVLMRAELARPGSIIKSNWKNGLAVITLAHVFHFFNSKDDESPSISLSLTNGSVEPAPARHPNAFSISVPKESYFSLSSGDDVYVFRAADNASKVQWLSMLKKSLRRGTSSVDDVKSPQYNQ